MNNNIFVKRKFKSVLSAKWMLYKNKQINKQTEKKTKKQTTTYQPNKQISKQTNKEK